MNDETKLKKAPEVDADAFSNTGASVGKKRTLWSYETLHTVHDVLRPNYFRNVTAGGQRNYGVRHGDRVDCIIGDVADGWEMRLAFDWSQRLDPVCVAIVYKHRLTPCRHGGAIDVAA